MNANGVGRSRRNKKPLPALVAAKRRLKRKIDAVAARAKAEAAVAAHLRELVK